MMNIPVPQGYRSVAENRVRENVGLEYGDLAPGLVIEHRPGRTVTDADNVLMTTLAGNVSPLHTDAHYSSKTDWGQILVCSGVTLNIVAGMTVRSVSGLTVANLALGDVRFEHPVFVGTTLYAETEIRTRRPSQSRPGHGVITCRTTGFDQDDHRVVRFTRTFLLPIDPAALRDATNY
ncbi:MaoC family dehydratase [Streptomyces sp. NPDC046977]|uniref:MaoC family dehydratase n=1 Tax=Streptomyces sp. NPDC046977 TaxID=3154703 RepID=UPI00340D6979